MKIRKWKVGADIEVFLRDTYTNNVVSAEGWIKGTKEEPFHFVEDQPFFMTSLDNVMAEFGIPPVVSADNFVSNIQVALDYISEIIPPQLEVFPVPSARLSSEWLQTEASQLAGCDPDFDVWTMRENPKPEVTVSNLRGCGGHIHISYEPPVIVNINQQIVKALDRYLALPSVLQEEDNERKSLYGKAGAYRNKEYGVEYRSISNYYLASPELTKWVFNQIEEAIDFINSGKFDEMSDDDFLFIREAINNNNKELALELVEAFGIKLAA